MRAGYLKRELVSPRGGPDHQETERLTIEPHTNSAEAEDSLRGAFNGKRILSSRARSPLFPVNTAQSGEGEACCPGLMASDRR